METVVRTAHTVEEAEELALKELGADRNEVEVEILSKGKAGFLGIGAELAQVRVTRLSAQVGDTDSAQVGDTDSAQVGDTDSAQVGDTDSAQVGDTDSTQVGDTSAAGLAVEVVNNILGPAKVNVVSTLRAAHDPEVGGPIIDLTGEDSGLLIGRRGQTLTALQFLANLIVRQELGEDVRVVLDVEHYRQRREASLRDMAAKVGSRVHQTGRSITLEPMSAADRRIIHVSLADHPGVSTESVGFGDDRKVTVNPKRE
jgi:spoIIIJ-associated protein